MAESQDAYELGVVKTVVEAARSIVRWFLALLLLGLLLGGSRHRPPFRVRTLLDLREGHAVLLEPRDPLAKVQSQAGVECFARTTQGRLVRIQSLERGFVVLPARQGHGHTDAIEVGLGSNVVPTNANGRESDLLCLNVLVLPTFRGVIVHTVMIARVLVLGVLAAVLVLVAMAEFQAHRSSSSNSCSCLLTIVYFVAYLLWQTRSPGILPCITA